MFNGFKKRKDVTPDNQTTSIASVKVEAKPTERCKEKYPIDVSNLISFIKDNDIVSACEVDEEEENNLGLGYWDTVALHYKNRKILAKTYVSSFAGTTNNAYDNSYFYIYSYVEPVVQLDLFDAKANVSHPEPRKLLTVIDSTQIKEAQFNELFELMTEIMKVFQHESDTVKLATALEGAE